MEHHKLENNRILQVYEPFSSLCWRKSDAGFGLSSFFPLKKKNWEEGFWKSLYHKAAHKLGRDGGTPSPDRRHSLYFFLSLSFFFPFFFWEKKRCHSSYFSSFKTWYEQKVKRHLNHYPINLTEHEYFPLQNWEITYYVPPTIRCRALCSVHQSPITRQWRGGKVQWCKHKMIQKNDEPVQMTTSTYINFFFFKFKEENIHSERK